MQPSCGFVDVFIADEFQPLIAHNNMFELISASETMGTEHD